MHGSIPAPAEASATQEQKRELVLQALVSSGTARFRALGSSMLPTIWPGDVLEIEATPRDNLVCGDLIAVHTTGGIRVHRLLRTNQPYWITRGDAMPQDDPAISPQDVLGRVSEIRRGQRVIIARRKLKRVDRGLAWFLKSSIICHITLRLRSTWLNRPVQDNASQLRREDFDS